tara:strand:- start:816 stop:1331 length:516 start_codon:yes stop_codon:yes gene_type:complete
MSLREWKNKELNRLLCEKFGISQKQQLDEGWKEWTLAGLMTIGMGSPAHADQTGQSSSHNVEQQMQQNFKTFKGATERAVNNTFEKFNIDAEINTVLNHENPKMLPVIQIIGPEGNPVSSDVLSKVLKNYDSLESKFQKELNSINPKYKVKFGETDRHTHPGTLIIKLENY